MQIILKKFELNLVSLSIEYKLRTLLSKSGEKVAFCLGTAIKSADKYYYIKKASGAFVTTPSPRHPNTHRT